MAREIVLDTETTGLSPATGHRMIEIACVELEDFIPTGRVFHRYMHPDRPIDADAQRVHGISIEFLADKPRFHEPDVCDALLEFLGEATLIAHNAPFDRGFVDAELEWAGRPTTGESRWVDTLAMAQKRFPGAYNSLDALCKRFKISLAEREKHSALIDTKLLAQVYLELRGGRERALDLTPIVAAAEAAAAAADRANYGVRPRPLQPRSTDAERQAHLAFVRETLKDNAIWLKFDVA